jgi:hypothetical protein
MNKIQQKGSNAEFEKAAAGKQASLIREFWGFLKENKKWWLLPILVILLMVGVLVFLGGTGVAPFVYSLF